MKLRLGIDTGGTYTDAVIVDQLNQILASQKSLTTAFDLSQGIDAAILGLPQHYLNEITLVALSTTLSTNSVVEERGAPVAVLLSGYTQRQLDKSGILDIIPRERISLLAGGHNAMGKELEPLDEAQVQEEILRHQNKVSAYAVSSMFATRNSVHEQRIKKYVQHLVGLPVACGNELASSLGAPQRALTVALNARMIPFIQLLLDSIKSVLGRHQIDAPLMIVKGDGSLINIQTAQAQPVSTVLSGPAASVLGAKELSSVNDALVIDIGGTTTDIAVVRDGKAELSTEGTTIGEWRPMVEAIRAFSIGLGGDSEIRFDGKLSISNRRVVPMSLLVFQYPHILATLKQQLQGLSNARHNRFALRLQSNQAIIDQLSPLEMQTWNLVCNEPIDINQLAERDRPMTRAIARLERLGLVIYSGFTPTDAMHVLGISQHWHKAAAEIATVIWARQMRYLYGCGDWSLDDPREASKAVFDLVIHQLSLTLLQAGLSQYQTTGSNGAKQLIALLSEIIFDDQASTGLFSLKFAKNLPMVGVGGPSKDFLPEVAKKLGIELLLPDHGETANAFGAVMARVSQSASVVITQPKHGVFYVFTGETPEVFDRMDLAIQTATSAAEENAKANAMAAGAKNVEITIEEFREHVQHDIDGELFLSARIVATASGRP